MANLLNEWLLKPEYLPGWLQAFAAIVALGISVWSVWWTSASVRRRDRREILGVAVAIYPEMLILKESAKTVRKKIADLKIHFPHLFGQSVGASFHTAATISMPRMLDRHIDRLFILGDLAGPSCLQLVRGVIEYNATIDGMAQRLMMMNAEQWKEALRPLEDHLGSLDQIIAKCEHELRPIHDSVKG